MECSKCGSNTITVTLDSRGLAEARCADCGALIKKMKTQELVEYYEDKIKELKGEPKDTSGQMPCRYCAEDYALKRGSIRMQRQYIPIKAEFCPMCGRKLEPKDRAY